MGCSHGWSNAEPVVIVISLISTAPAGAAELEGQDADFLRPPGPNSLHCQVLWKYLALSY